MHRALYHFGAEWRWQDNLRSGAIPRVIASERDERIRIVEKSTYTALVKRYGRP